MSAPAEDLPEWPEGVLEAELAGFDAAGREPDDGCGGWIDDALSAEIDAELDAGQRDECGEPGWAVPGVEGGDRGPDGLSVGSVAVLAETTAAWRALRAAQARCYRARSAIAESDVLGTGRPAALDPG